ncbi:MAG TPA: DUF1326 domain-containing protein [Chthonomonadaceae bacterium]|nr:DUF1326 domain-containing protein [Chthonomonadaceae bacterium]
MVKPIVLCIAAGACALAIALHSQRPSATNRLPAAAYRQSCAATPAKQRTSNQEPGTASPPRWTAVGTLLEACSCAVPCPCNFRQPPTHGYCNTVYAYRLKTGAYEGVKLDGLVFGGGEADKGAIAFVDARATREQRPALEKLAKAVFARGGASTAARRFESVPIVATDGGRQFRVSFGDSGGFAADVLFGRDPSRPIVVENNTTWPVDRFVKGVATKFDYHDPLQNRIALEGVNANIGEFRLASP